MWTLIARRRKGPAVEALVSGAGIDAAKYTILPVDDFGIAGNARDECSVKDVAILNDHLFPRSTSKAPSQRRASEAASRRSATE